MLNVTMCIATIDYGFKFLTNYYCLIVNEITNVNKFSIDNIMLRNLMPENQTVDDHVMTNKNTQENFY